MSIRKKKTPIHEGANENSGVVAFGKKGARFSVTGSIGPWLRIQLAKNRPGYILKENTSFTSKKPSENGTVTNWQITPPSLQLNTPSNKTDKSEYILNGIAKDDTHLEDVYIFVSNREAKVEHRKVFYLSNRGSKSQATLPFSAKIPVFPGLNRIIVVARENKDVKTVKVVNIYRTK